MYGGVLSDDVFTIMNLRYNMQVFNAR